VISKGEERKNGDQHPYPVDGLNLEMPGEVRIHRAKWVIRAPDRIIENGFVSVCEGRIVDCGPWDRMASGPVTDHGEGVLMPATVNGHTHLDLTPLAGKMDGLQGFLPWVKEIIRLKDHLREEDIRKGLRDGVSMARNGGACLVGDHRSLPFSNPEHDGHPVIYRFREYLGSREEAPAWEGKVDGFFSLAAHAPHTTAPWLIRSLKNAAASMGRVFSVHVAESEEEASFIQTGCGPWGEILSGRGVDFSRWGLPARSPVWHLESLGVLDHRTLAVHLVQAGAEDLDLIARRGTHVCVCPRSNHRLVGRLPDVPAMLKRSIRPALGTDSLASVDSLSVFHEMSFLWKSLPSMRPEDILAMGTLNGAEALGMSEHFGTLDPGKAAAVLFVPADGPSAAGLLAAVVGGHFKGVVEILT
jgi:cytosine/adenosine deaminase-related metal-dependent hydrolase